MSMEGRNALKLSALALGLSLALGSHDQEAAGGAGAADDQEASRETGVLETIQVVG